MDSKQGSTACLVFHEGHCAVACRVEGRKWISGEVEVGRGGGCHGGLNQGGRGKLTDPRLIYILYKTSKTW